MCCEKLKQKPLEALSTEVDTNLSKINNKKEVDLIRNQFIVGVKR